VPSIKFDPAMALQFFHLRPMVGSAGMTGATTTGARTIRLPIHVSEKLSKIAADHRELSHRFGGRQPQSDSKWGLPCGIEPRTWRILIPRALLRPFCAHAGGDEDRAPWENDPDSGSKRADGVQWIRSLPDKEHLGAWLSQLN